MRELTDAEVLELAPGLTATGETSDITEERVFGILRAAVAAELFLPYLVTVWRATDDLGNAGVALTVNMGDGIQLCGPVWDWRVYRAPKDDGTGPLPLNGLRGARRVLWWADRNVRTATEAYERKSERN